MSRSKWKGPYVDLLFSDGKGTENGLKINTRTSTILPIFLGRILEIHNGVKYIPVKITASMIGHKFGEFVSTKKHVKHKKFK